MATKEILWHALDLHEVLKKLKTNRGGLTKEIATERLKKIGPNKLPEEKQLSGFVIFLQQFKSPLVYVLIGAAVISVVLADAVDTIIIMAAVIINVILGFYQENKANKAITHLRKLVDLKTKVFRDGGEIVISSKELVPGDIIFLSPGDKIAADARLIEIENLQVTEASLTGESIPSEKQTKKLNKGAALADRENMVFAGTVIARGSAKAVVCETGLNTEIGKITKLVQGIKEGPTPLQKQISSLSKLLTVMVVAVSVLLIIVGALQGRPIIAFGEAARESMLLLAAAVAVSAIPEGLIITMTAILSVGMQAILKRKALVRKLIATETLGSVSIICTDKTGTLTQGVMSVEHIITFNDVIKINNLKSYRPVGTLKDYELISKISLLCNNAVIENPEAKLEGWKIIGDPTESALTLAAIKSGITRHELEKIQPRLKEVPFDSETKYMATLNRLDQKKNVIYLKGAPEKILAMSTKIRIGGQKEKLTSAKKEALKNKYEKLTSQGLRLLAFGYKQTDRNKKTADLKDELDQITFVGFIALKDPLRPEAKETFKLTRRAGIRPIIVTGDHKLTAKAIVTELGLNVKEENILLGAELDKISDEELQKIVSKIDIYARVEPRHKLRIIDAWQKLGEVVAMTGDGVNDAPAIKAADIGIALGSGTDVAKETSDMILLDNNFKTIIAAVEHGRIIFENIKKVTLYLLSDSFAEIILIVGALIFRLPLPILPAQILWINIIDDGLPALALTGEPGEKGIMQEKPRKKNAPIMDREVKTLIFIIGVITNILLLGFFYFLLEQNNYEINHIRTLIFSTLAISTLLYVFSTRSLRHSIFTKNPFNNKFLVGAVVIGIILQLMAVYQPQMQKIFETVPLSLTDWIIILAIGIIDILLIEITKHHFLIKVQKNK